MVHWEGFRPDMIMTELHVEVGSIPVRISSDDGEFIDYARGHFGPAVRESLRAFAVETSFLRGKIEDEGTLISRFDRIGRDTYTDGDLVLWMAVPYFPGLAISVRRGKDTLFVEAIHAPGGGIGNRLRKIASTLRGGHRSRSVFYFELLYHLVYYPVFRVLLDRGVHVLHGGGVEVGGRRVVIVGAQGTGKSTLIANLLVKAGSRFLSDNIIFFDRTRVFSCHEPIRLDSRMIASMPALRDLVEPIDLDVPLGRTACTVRAETVLDSMEPDDVIVPRMSRAATGLVPCPKESVIRKARCFNALADEVRTFELFGSVIGQVFPSRYGCAHEIETLDRLLEGARLFEMNIRYGEDPVQTARIFIDAVCGRRCG